MGERPAKRRRLFIHDERRNGSYLRATWHPERRTLVMSTWNRDVCTGAVRVPAAEAPELVSLIVDGLAELAQPPAAVAPAPPAGWEGLRRRLRQWLARPAATSTVLRLGPRAGTREPRSRRHTA